MARLSRPVGASVGGAAAGLLGSRPLERAAGVLFRDRLRVLAYHEVNDHQSFRSHMEHLVSRFTVVDETQVAAAFHQGDKLAPNSVWVTFDDGHPSVFRAAQPILDDLGVQATAFVNPSVIGSDRPLWFQAVRAAHRENDATTVMRRLKSMDDAGRRRETTALLAGSAPYTQATAEQLTTWLEAGHRVGNHTWDHPLLRQCSEGEIRAQVERAHHWFTETLGVSPTSFAYPDGSWNPVTEMALEELGYELAVGFDHRLATAHSHPFRVSRLRISDDAPLHRLSAVVSGWHQLAYHLKKSRSDASRSLG